MHARLRTCASILVILGVVAACGSNASSDAAPDRTTTTTGADTEPNRPSTTAPGGGSQSDGTPESPAGTTSPTVAGTAKGAPPFATPAQPPAPQQAALPAPSTVPAPGQYHFHASGSYTLAGKASPVDYDGATTLERLSATDVRHGGGGDLQGLVLRYTASEVRLVSLEIGQAPCLFRFDADPPKLFAPAPPSDGQKWEWTLQSADLLTTVTAASQAVRQETIDVLGAKVKTVVIDSTITLTGKATGSIKLTTHFDSTRRLALRTPSVIDVVACGFDVSADITSDFTGFTPQP